MINKLENKEYIIVEIIPTSPNPKTGDIAQLSALKLKGLNLIDRFDLRLNDDKINNIYIKEMINYDKENFLYKDTTQENKNNKFYAKTLKCRQKKRLGFLQVF